MIKRNGESNAGYGRLSIQGNDPRHTWPEADAVRGKKMAHIRRRGAGHDVSSLGQVLKKFITWLRDLFSND
ncbi:hypothetical protein [Acerihabitans arboris]|uniref:Uncharacterized protein n=1 Tax=Acerihabitans arboris TaxID=2691583 RepID=A0A845SPV4_9GAMM|nr:hypothetical protein [Acerihabitans arboris]NDL64956.1 hypothetical protein [Acerihabitans arboris]